MRRKPNGTRSAHNALTDGRASKNKRSILSRLTDGR
jgi:hypothetical protein